MSHEIRTPINAVLGMNEMILRECKDEQLLSYAANIQSSGKTLLFLINDILDLSKIESGKMEIIPVEYELFDLLLDLWNVIYMRANEKNLKINFLIDETLPKTLYGDDVRVKQIVTNLLTNAVKYTPEGEVELKVNYQKDQDNTILLIISVKDTGIGIKQEDMGRLFEDFRRLDEGKNRKIEGTGLGMNITLSLLKLMGGDINVESEYQKGSVFTVKIPQKVVNNEPCGSFEKARNMQRQGKLGSQESFEAPQANILVVDDNAMNLTVFKSLLKRTKVNVVTASSGKECLELVKKSPYHIIFMDHMMPEMDGIETLHEIKKLTDFPNDGVPIIVLTANALSGARESYLAEGFTDFLTKPIDGDKLEKMIVYYLPKEIVHKKENDDSQTEESSSNKSEYDKYSEYGISIEQGLSYSKGNLDVYLDLIDMFLNDDNQQDKLEKFIFEENMNDYGIQVHALKGNARTLGANELADIAFEHEKQSKAGNIDYVDQHWGELVEKWNTAREGFEQFCIDNGRIEADESETVDMDREIFEISPEDFEAAASLIDDFETEKALEMLNQWLKNNLRQDERKRIKSAVMALEKEFDEEKAIEILRGN